MALKTEMPLTFGSLFRKLLLYYSLALLLGDAVIILGNVLVAKSRGLYLVFSSSFILGGSFVMLIVLLSYSFIRLKSLRLAFQPDFEERERRKLFARLLTFPYEIYWGIGVFAIVLMIAFHVGDAIFRQLSWSSLDAVFWKGLLGSIMKEMSIAITVGVLIFTFLRRLFRNFLRQLPLIDPSDVGKSTVLNPLLLTIVSTFAIALLYLQDLNAQAEWEGVPPDSGAMAIFSLFYFALGLAVLSMSATTFRDELRDLIEGLKGLADRGRRLRSPMPVLARDETGELAVAFNSLQEKIAMEYEELEQELQLALKVQQKLLPASEHSFGRYEVAAVCRPHREVGGDLFDVAPLDGGRRFAFIIGDVSGKGVPAALIMSAVMVLFRSEIRLGGGPGEVLTRLNRQLCGTIRDNAMVTIGIGIIDTDSHELRYASGGHMSPYLVRGESATMLSCSSLPLGLEDEVTYEEFCLTLAENDVFVTYTDGMIESIGEGEGFALFESMLMPPGGQELLIAHAERMVERCGASTGSRADDRTLLMVSRRPEAAAECVWEMKSRPGNEKAIVGQVAEWAVEAGLPAARADDLRSALAEASINAMEHGNGYDPEAKVVVEACRNGIRRIVIRVHDGGRGFAVPLPDRESMSDGGSEPDVPRGYGLRMIEELCDEWRLGNGAAGFYVELIFETRGEMA